ncbi:MAG: hypothetical protein ABH841_01040, partial [Candidatus Nealsonbacteria bacterium]
CGAVPIVGELKILPDVIQAFKAGKNATRIEAAAKIMLKEVTAEAKLVKNEIKLATKGEELSAVAKISHRLDYSKDFEKDIIRNFKPGSKIFHGKLNDDLVIVQFHADKSIGLAGEGRSLKYWTSVGQANEFKTMDDVLQELALMPEWGERGIVSLARIPKGTQLAFCFGQAVQKASETGQIFRGGGIQYLFKDFDPSWIVKTRKIPK